MRNDETQWIPPKAPLRVDIKDASVLRDTHLPTTEKDVVKMKTYIFPFSSRCLGGRFLSVLPRTHWAVSILQTQVFWQTKTIFLYYFLIYCFSICLDFFSGTLAIYMWSVQNLSFKFFLLSFLLIFSSSLYFASYLRLFFPLISKPLIYLSEVASFFFNLATEFFN